MAVGQTACMVVYANTVMLTGMTVVTHKDDNRVLAQVALGNAATIAPVSVAETFLDLKSTVHLDLTHPVMIHSVGLSIKDQSPVLPIIKALRQAVKAAL